jgi:ATP-dependent helicase/nuclease subunit A
VTTNPAYFCNGERVGADAFYAVACDPRRSVVVEACAGAGKTWTLVARIVRALLAGAEPASVLAITFTRKAAGEMRERLRRDLRELAEADAARRVQLLRERGLDEGGARAAAPLAATLLDRVLAGGREVELRTFHAWFAHLLRAAPLDLLRALGLAPGMALVEDIDDLRPALHARLHAQLLADPALRADHAALVARHGRATLAQWLDAALAKRIEIEFADADGGLADAVPPPELSGPRWAALPAGAHPAALWTTPAGQARWRALARALAAIDKVATRQAAEGIGLALDAAALHADPAEVHARLRAALCTDAGRGPPRKLLGPRDDPALAEALREAAADLEAVDELLAQQQASADHGAMARLARALLAQWARLKREQGLVDMADLELVARRLLADPVVSGAVLQRLDARVRHLLIDEFQDTNPLQWHTLRGWLDGYAGAGGGAAPPVVFIVGDPKQSIYRFRRAEPRVFAAAREFVVGALGGDALACDHTRRNHPAVLRVVNAVFEGALAQGEYAGYRVHTSEVAGDAASAALYALPRVPKPPKRARVPAAAAGELDWRPSLRVPRRDAEQHRRELEAAQVADAVAGLVGEGFAPGRIQVLARKRDTLRRVADALRARHLPYATPEESPLAAQPEVRDLVALLDVLASPGHDLSLAHALRSPLFDASDEDLAALAQAARASGCSWCHALAALAQPAPALARARRLLAGWAQAAAVLPPHDLLDRIVAEGELWPRLAARVPPERWPAARQAVRALLALSLSLDGGRYTSPYRFVRALRRRALKMAAGASANAVQLLTVHGAKGLEADAVLLVDTDAPPPRADTATLLVDWPPECERPRRVAFVASEARCPPSLRGLLAAEQAERAREELNALYVALTRARQRLIASASEPHHAAGRSWWARLQALAVPLELAPALVTPPPVPGVTVNMLPELPAAAALVPAALAGEAGADTEGADARQTDNEVAARLGRAVHRLLEWCASAGDVQIAVDAAAPAAVAAHGLPPSAAALAAAHARAVLLSAQAAPFFGGAGLRWAGNEVTLADDHGLLRIDRLVCRETASGVEWWVLDYKLAPAPQDDPALRAQLARYRAAVQALQPGERVRAAFVTGVGEVVEVAAV